MSGWRSNYSYGGGQGSNWRGNWQQPQPPPGPPPAKKAKQGPDPKAKQPPKPPGTGTCKADREKKRRPLIDELPVVRAELREQEDESLVRQTAIQTKYELTFAMAETSQKMLRKEEDGQRPACATFLALGPPLLQHPAWPILQEQLSSSRSQLAKSQQTIRMEEVGCVVTRLKSV